MIGFIVLVAIIGICSFGEASMDKYNKYGGWNELKTSKSGFFRVEKIEGVWWIIDPEGYAFVSKGVNHISWSADHAPSLGYSPYGKITKEKYGNADKWAKASIGRLRNWNFNTVGAWSSHETFNKDMPYTIIMNIGASAGSDWLKGSFPDVFSESFRNVAEKIASEVCKSRVNDPFLFGYFTDNELRWGPDWRSPKTLFDDFLAMPEYLDGKKALVKTFMEIYGSIDKLNSALNTNLKNFNDLFRITDLSQLGELPKLAQSELSDKRKINFVLPKELIMLYLNQFYGNIDNVNKAFGTKAESFNELLTDEFMARVTAEISKQKIPKEMIIAGIEMVYGNLEKANKAFNTNAKTYDELIDYFTVAQDLSSVAYEIRRIRSIFLKKIAEQYFKVCKNAIKKYDQNHIILGCRFAGYAPVEVLEAMSKHVDVISYNNYSPEAPINSLEGIHKITGKPIIITEFSFKAMDSGLPNTKGAGVPVATQKDRADGFERYVKALMKTPYVVGYHWFEHADEPAEGRFDGENSNYGLVTIKDEPWEILVNRMKQVNAEVEKIHKKASINIPKVPKGHPRVYVRPSDINEIRNKLNNPEFTRTWNLVRSSENPLCKAFIYMVLGEQESGRKAITNWFDDFEKYANDPDRAGRIFQNLLHTGACVYDWCYDLLKDEEKWDFIKKLEIIASSHSPGYPANLDGHAVVGHDTEGWVLTGQLPAGVAIYDESKTMYDASAELFFNKFVPVRNFFYPANMHHQGDSYFQTRFQHDQAVSWLFRRMGVDNIFTPQMQFVPYQFIYNMRPDGQQIHSGDTFNERGNDPRKRVVAMMTASYYDDPYLMYMAESDFFDKYDAFDCVFELLFKKSNAKKLPISELPLTKYFPSPMGEMIDRTGWNMGIDSKDAVVQMRIGEYFFGNHQCKDFGTFQIYYRGALAISSGIYDKYGSEHWKNYLHQTISKNGLLIFDPNEEIKEGFINDGGQRFPKGSDHPRNLEILLTDDYKMGQVISHEFGPDKLTPEYSYISGDITNAYSPKKVRKVLRSMVTFNTNDEKYPCIFIVMDNIHATDPSFKKTWLLHSIQEPSVNGKIITIIRDGKYLSGEYGGKLVLKNLLPEKVEIKKIGGEGKEFWIESVQRNYEASKEGITEGGSWRIEISPTQMVESDTFLNVMCVMDKNTTNYPKITKIEQDNLIGAKILNFVALFNYNDLQSNHLNFTIDQKGNYKIFICNLRPGVWSIKRNGSLLGKFSSSEEGKSIYFSASEGKYDLCQE
ncbi:MAG: heparinase II/III domain-containing protein [bacterium]